jgi:hypothetical protein
MKILLVNSNPVVSRLTALSARKESVKLDEIKDISELKNSDYDIVFVDFESYSRELSTVLGNSNISKRVLFHTQDDREKPEIFNITILKPFLPSEVSAVLRERKIELEKNPPQEPEEEYLDLNELIAEKKDDLTPITLEDDKVKSQKKKEDIEVEPMPLIEDEIIEPKIEKEIEDKKDKIELEPTNIIDDKKLEEELLEELNQSKDKIEKIEKSPDLNIVELPREEARDESKLFELDIDDNKESSSDTNELFEVDSEVDSSDELKDELLNFDIDSKDEVDFDTNLEDKSTKILDGDEISNIKNLLNSEEIIDEDVSLEDVMTTTTPKEYIKLEKKTKKKKKKKAKKSIDNPKLSSEVITDTLRAMPIDDLRRLLLGTKIHITIEFPKEF